MLEKIQNNNSELIGQSQGLDRISQIGASNPFKNVDADYFVDQSEISSAAFEKYQRELDIQTFSDILMKTDEKASTELVMKQAFEGLISIDDNDFLLELLDNEDFLNDIK